MTNEEILDCLVPVGELDEVTLTELVRQQDPKAVIDLLGTWRIPWAKPLTTAFPEFARSGDLGTLKCALTGIITGKHSVRLKPLMPTTR